MESPSLRGEDGLNNVERYQKWRTSQAIAAWHRRDLKECYNIAHELLDIPSLPLWHRCTLNFYLAGVARIKDLPELGKTHLQETLHYLDVLKGIRKDASEDEDPVYTRLQLSAESCMIQLEADILESRDRFPMQTHTLEASTSAPAELIPEDDGTSNIATESSDTPMATQAPDTETVADAAGFSDMETIITFRQRSRELCIRIPDNE